MREHAAADATDRSHCGIGKRECVGCLGGEGDEHGGEEDGRCVRQALEVPGDDVVVDGPLQEPGLRDDQDSRHGGGEQSDTPERSVVLQVGKGPPDAGPV